MIHSDDREMVQQYVARVLAGEDVPPIEHRILHRNGTVRWVRDTIVPYRDQTGSLLHYDGLVEDITERKRGEARFRQLLEAAPDAMFITNQDGRILLVNAQTEQLFGYRRGELLGQLIEIIVPARHRDRHRELRLSCASSLHPRSMGLESELLCARKDGSEFQVDVSLRPIQTEEGIRISSSVRDVTERRQTELMLREREAQLLAAQRIQEHLLPDRPPTLPGFDIAGATYPAEFAAGDYFDYLAMPGERLGIVISDVAGHGIGPALLMASTHAHVQSLAETGLSIEQILGRLNSFLMRETEPDRFVTLLLACLDPATRTLTYVSAGHPTGYVLDDSGKVKARLESTAFPLGILSDTTFPAGSVTQLEPGDLVLLLTDGLLEAASPEGAYFGLGKALEIVLSNRQSPAETIVQRLYQAVQEFCKGRKLIDDVTVIVIKVARNG
jgi:sigma-B regulation protein RsbU (phosphoserine phosphatase)